jgi:hypothetical protein
LSPNYVDLSHGYGKNCLVVFAPKLFLFGVWQCQEFCQEKARVLLPIGPNLGASAVLGKML